MLQINKLNLKTFFSPLFLLIFSATLLYTLTDQFVTKQVELLISSKDGLSNMIFFWGFVSIFSSLVFPLLASTICSYYFVKTDKTLTSFFATYFELGFIESLRSWGKVFLWGFLLILPAFYKYIQLVLTPYVVFFSKKYQQGKVDALDYSKLFSKKFWWRLKLYLTFFMLVVPACKYYFFDNFVQFSETPAQATLIVFGLSLAEILFQYGVLKLFISALNSEEPEPMEVNYAPHV